MWLVIAGTRETPKGVLLPVKQGVPPVLTNTCSIEYVPTLANTHLTSTVAHVKGKINNMLSRCY